MFPITKRHRLPSRRKPNERLRKFLQAVEENEWYPFVSEVEFEIARIIIESKLPMKTANDLLNVSRKGRSEEEFQLKNVYQLREKLKDIPKEKWEIKRVPDPRATGSHLDFYFKDVRPSLSSAPLVFLFIFCSHADYLSSACFTGMDGSPGDVLRPKVSGQVAPQV